MKEAPQRDIGVWQFFGFAATSLLGTLLHFLYDWTESRAVALFSAVNESTWEHMKLLFFPMLLFTLVQGIFFHHGYPNFWCVKLRGILLGLLLIPTLFYTLQGVFGQTPDWVNIGIFFVAAAATYRTETKALKMNGSRCRYAKIALLLLLLLALIFFVFTFLPPHIPLFRDPIDGQYGIAAE